MNALARTEAAVPITLLSGPCWVHDRMEYTKIGDAVPGFDCANFKPNLPLDGIHFFKALVISQCPHA